MAELKKVDLFGNEEVFMVGKPNRKPNLFTNYDAFVDKFEAKKTTDDCYTPPLVYDAAAEILHEKERERERERELSPKELEIIKSLGK